MANIINNLLEIKERIKNISPNVKLVAVSKFQPKEAITQAIKAGHSVFGENRVQEALEKWPELKKNNPDIKLHLIGPLQTNKIKDAIKIFDVIEVVDRPKLAESLLKEMKNADKFPVCYIQVNVGSEPQKAGVLPEEADFFIEKCVSDGLRVKGLMCIPPVNEDPVPYFKMLKNLADKNGLAEISMGMSADYELAIAHGATEVRVGSQIFGSRSI
ncbi:MAG: YggS family pyridoxal phosphate-dependent enzyme [Rickettsiaceae bacterium]|jgi:pyridoxal phosphate enzyme (YggS family)|nr:YggS family pyridoxal phosphate-dependent enzyme [Rickettsiaceae bacterium]